MRTTLTKFLNLIIIFACLGCLILSIGGFFPELNWRLGWYSHPRPHFVLFGIATAGWLMYQRVWFGAGVSLLIVIINGAVLAPFFMGSPGNPTVTGDLSLLHLNTNKGAADMAPLADYQADILFLQEVTPELEANFDQLFPNYRVALSHPLTNTQGIAMLTHEELCLLYTSPSPRDQRGSRMPSSA